MAIRSKDWRPVPNFEGLYWINIKGVVMNSKNVIIASREHNGVKKVELYGNGQRELIPVSTLVLDVFPEIYKEELNER